MSRSNIILTLTALSGSALLSHASIIPVPRDVTATVAAGPPWPVEAGNLPSGWSYTGCFIDSTSSRLLGGAYEASAFYSRAETCVSFCTGQGMPVAGLEYGGECFCGPQLPASAVSDSESCTMPCKGNSTQACGAADRLSVYSGPGSIVPVVNPGVGGFASLGCYTDSVSARTLSQAGNTPGGADVMTNAVCAEACKASTYYGVEYGGECFCGNSIDNGGQAAPAAECNMACKGDRSELCGGKDRLNLYSKPFTSPTTTPAAPPTAAPTAPANACPAGKSVNLCCRAIEPWKTNTANWGGVCGYYPADPNSLTGAVCQPSK